MTKFTIERPIGELTLNGLEYLLNTDGSVKEFNSKAEAESFLFQNGVEKKDIDNYFINTI